jgi:hypothetical protein
MDAVDPRGTPAGSTTALYQSTGTEKATGNGSGVLTSSAQPEIGNHGGGRQVSECGLPARHHATFVDLKRELFHKWSPRQTSLVPSVEQCNTQMLVCQCTLLAVTAAVKYETLEEQRQRKHDLGPLPARAWSGAPQHGALRHATPRRHSVQSALPPRQRSRTPSAHRLAQTASGSLDRQPMLRAWRRAATTRRRVPAAAQQRQRGVQQRGEK